MDARSFDAPTKQMLNDYKLIQYDITAGKHYLENTDFMTLPEAGAKGAAATAGDAGGAGGTAKQSDTKQSAAKGSASNTAASASVPAAASALSSLDLANGSATGAAHQREGQVARSGH
jgi:hypothetical protein